MDRKLTVFLPCRAGSERIPQKNIKPFGGFPYGLFEIKLNQLLSIPSVNKIVVSTNDSSVIDYIKNTNHTKVQPDIRPESLCTSQTTTDELIRYVPTIIDSEHILWTHVTSPMCDAPVYEEAIHAYFDGLEKKYDSLMSVNVVQKFLFREDFSAVNFDRSVELWPRTQTLKPVYEANSALFISSLHNYLRYNDRIGRVPLFFELNQFQSFDIDREEDFIIGEMIWSKLHIPHG